MLELDWSLCRSFLAILDSGSLSGAAKRLGVTHPTIRRHLEELETVLGAKLFARSPSGLVATPLARALREPAEAMASAANRLQRHVSSATGEPTGIVRIAASEVIGAEVLPPMLAALRDTHPMLRFELVLGNAIEDVLRLDADIAVRMTRPRTGGLRARRIGSVALGLYAHRDWLARRAAPGSVADLARDGMMIGDLTPGRLEARLQQAGVTIGLDSFAVRASGDLAQLAALRAGLGIGVCQCAIAMRDPALVRILPEVEDALDLWLVSHPDLRAEPRIDAVIDALGTKLAAYAAA